LIRVLTSILRRLRRQSSTVFQPSESKTGPRSANDIALVSASFGGVDEIKTLPFHDGIDAFFYTDEVTRKNASPESLASWTKVLIPAYPRRDFGPRLASRYFKHQIHRLDEVASYRWLIWADASVQLHQVSFIAEHVAALCLLPRRKRLLLIPHPERQTVRAEFEHIREEIDKGNEGARLRYANENMAEQMLWFQAHGWNIEARLWCGTFWMVENNEVINRCWDDWWDQQLRWGMMDQLSLPVLLEEHGCVPQSLEIDLYDNELFTKIPHKGPISDTPGVS